MENRLKGSTFRPDEVNGTDESKDFLCKLVLELPQDKWERDPTRGLGYPWRDGRRFYDAGPGLYAMCFNLCVCQYWSWARFKSVDDEVFATPNGKEFWEPYDYITGFFVNQLHLEVGIAWNDAITENTVALFVGMCIRTATFFVGKPGTSKSLFLSLNLLTGQSAAATWAYLFLRRSVSYTSAAPLIHVSSFSS